MTTLTETAYYTRKGLIWFGIGIVVFFILRYLVLLFITLLSSPPLPPKPTVGFGKLPGLVFEQRETPPQITYRLQTKEGGLPSATDSAKVYFIPQQLPNLLANERAKKFAAQLGFNQEPIHQTPAIFQFFDSNYTLMLTLNTVTNNFTLKYDYLSNPDAMGTPTIKPESAVTESQDFFKRLGILPKTISDEFTRTQLLRLEGRKLVETTSLSRTQAIRVDFFDQDLDNFPIVTNDFIHSQIYAIYTGNRDRKTKFIEVSFTYFPVEVDTYETYPLKSPNDAWEELGKGQGFIANLGGMVKEAIIRKVYLAYFQANDYQVYLQPVFVFEGDKEFVAYVQAIIPEWVGSPTITKPRLSPLQRIPSPIQMVSPTKNFVSPTKEASSSPQTGHGFLE